jgi:hypothetical protein
LFCYRGRILHLHWLDQVAFVYGLKF